MSSCRMMQFDVIHTKLRHSSDTFRVPRKIIECVNLISRATEYFRHSFSCLEKCCIILNLNNCIARRYENIYRNSFIRLVKTEKILVKNQQNLYEISIIHLSFSCSSYKKIFTFQKKNTFLVVELKIKNINKILIFFARSIILIN